MAAAILQHPSAVKRRKGASAVLQVVATGVAPLTYTWYKDGVALVGEVAAVVALSNLDRADSGSYWCIVNDSDGVPVSSLPARVSVINVVGTAPLMSSAGGSGGFTATASASSATAYLAFDGQVASELALNPNPAVGEWLLPSGVTSGWLQLTNPAALIFQRYFIFPPTDLARAPRTWRVEGSNDGATWTVLDTRANSAWQYGVAVEYALPSTIAYAYYRLNILPQVTAPAVSELILLQDSGLQAVVTVGTPTLTVGTEAVITVAAAVGPGRTLAGIQLYAGAELIGSSATTPLVVNWTPTLSHVGSQELVGVAINDLGEELPSSSVWLEVAPAVASTPPTVLLVDPVPDSQFLVPSGGVARLPIRFQVVGLADELVRISLLEDTVEVAQLTLASSGTYVWYQAVAGEYDYKLEVETSSGHVVQSNEVTVTISGVAAVAPALGDIATVLAETSGGAVPGAVAYAWRFWDKTVETTSSAVIQRRLNRATTAVELQLVDAYGRSVIKQVAGVAVTLPPVIESITVAATRQVLPYYATLTVKAAVSAATCRFVWRDSRGLTLTASTPEVDGQNFSYVHLVTGDVEILTLEIADGVNSWIALALDLTLAGKTAAAPQLGGLATGLGLRPVAMINWLEPVYAAAVEPIFRLIGQPSIDGVTPPPAWYPGSNQYVRGTPARVLARRQGNAAANTTYLVTSANVDYTLVSAVGPDSGEVTWDLGTQAFKFSTTDRHGVDVTDLLADLLRVGRQVRIESADSSGEIVATVIGVSIISGVAVAYVQFTAQDLWAVVDLGHVRVSFGWAPTGDQVQVGTTVPVLRGARFGGLRLTAVTDESSAGAAQWVVADPTLYGGSSLVGGSEYVEVGARHLDQLPITLDFDAASLVFQQFLDAAAITRVKIATDELAAGEYQVITMAADAHSTPGYVANQVLKYGQLTVL